MLQFDIISIFPKIFDSYFNESMLKLAQEKKKVKIKVHDLRKFTTDKHHTVDDKPYGGGPGMVFKIEPLFKAIKSVTRLKKPKRKIILLDPGGKLFDQKMAKRFSKLDQLVLIAGHYEGFDERVKKFVDERVSIGQYVLTGGEVPAMAIVDATTRLVPGVLGQKDSLKEETYSISKEKEEYVEYPQYTRPEIFEAQGKKLRVPKILLSGNHKKIIEWRKNNQKS